MATSDDVKEIFTRLSGIEKSINSIEASTRVVTDLVAKHDRVLYGQDGNNGCTARQRDMDGVLSGWRWNFRVMWVAFLGLFGKFIYDLIHRGN